VIVEDVFMTSSWSYRKVHEQTAAVVYKESSSTINSKRFSELAVPLITQPRKRKRGKLPDLSSTRLRITDDGNLDILLNTSDNRNNEKEKQTENNKFEDKISETEGDKKEKKDQDNDDKIGGIQGTDGNDDTSSTKQDTTVEPREILAESTVPPSRPSLLQDIIDTYLPQYGCCLQIQQ
jgi:hypothetical protein